MNQENLEDFLETVAPHLGRMTITYLLGEVPGTTVNTTVAPPEPEPAPVEEKKKAVKRKKKKIFRKRHSKVNDTLLTVIGAGTASVKEMKEALSAAGLSPGSLSTGLATLQREGVIVRAGDGLYRIPNLYQAPEAAPEAASDPEPAAAE
jgi:hypothetical protein